MVNVPFLNYIPLIEGYLWRKCLQGDDEACEELAEGFWDRRYLWRFGLWPQPYVIPERIGPEPDPIPYFVEQVTIHEHLLVDLIEKLPIEPRPWTNEPNPQPSEPKPQFITRLLDPQTRLESARRLSEKLRQAVGALDKEVEWLEQRIRQTGKM